MLSSLSKIPKLSLPKNPVHDLRMIEVRISTSEYFLIMPLLIRFRLLLLLRLAFGLYYIDQDGIVCLA